MNTLLPGGRPQNVSFVPLTNRLLCTVSANQFVRLKFVENCGRSVQLFVPVDRKTTRFVRTSVFTIRMLGGGIVTIELPKPCIEQS